MDGIVSGVKVALTLGLAIVVLGAAALVPLGFEEISSDALSVAPLELSEPIYQIEPSPDETALLVRTWKDIHVRDLNTGELLWTLPPCEATPAKAVWIPHSRRMLVGFADGRLMLWEPNGFLRWDFPEPQVRDTIRALAITRDGAIAVTGTAEGICVWNLRTRTLQSQCPLREGRLTEIVLSPDETQILLGCDDGRVKILRLSDLGLVTQHRPETRCISHVRYLNAGKQILVGHLDGMSFIMDANSGKILQRLVPAWLHLLDLEVSPDEQFVALTDWKSEIRVYSLKTLERVATLKGHTKAVSVLRFSPSLPVLYSAGYDGSVRSWDLNSFSDLGGFQASVPNGDE